MPDEQLIFNGINGDSGDYLLPPLEPAQVVKLAKGEPLDPEHTADLKERREEPSRTYLSVVSGVDPRDLAQAGWGVIFAWDDRAQVPALLDALRPLLDLRREQAGGAYGEGGRYREYKEGFSYRTGESKNAFLMRHGIGAGPVDPTKMPYYLLLVGDPERIPYRFQYQLDVQFAVGRIYFDTLEEYANYARSVVAAETGATRVDRSLALFGVQNRDDRSTNLSAEQLIKPLHDHMLEQWPDWRVDTFVGEGEATKAQLGHLLGGAQTPGLLFTASHGLGFPNGSSRQLAHQGALLCQDWPGPLEWQKSIPEDFYFSGDDVRADANLKGAIAFHFACYGAGTPRLDDFAHQKEVREQIAPHAFVARLPQRLLGHPRGGALAVLGHVERAWGYSFHWGRAGSQTAVFESTLGHLMRGFPVGAALEYFNERYAELAADLSVQLEDLRFEVPIDERELAGTWTANNDARSYVIIGDPAVRLPMDASAVERETIPEVLMIENEPTVSPTPTPTPTPAQPPVAPVVAGEPGAARMTTAAVERANGSGADNPAPAPRSVSSPVAVAEIEPAPAFDVSTRTCKVGVHGRNDVNFFDADYRAIREAKLEVIKMMSQTHPDVFARISAENPGIEFITRLYDDRIGRGHHPTPVQFAERMIPIMAGLRHYCTKFQILNEPNHVETYEGWGPRDEDAASFNAWFLDVYDRLKQAHPWAKLGFPGLAVPDAAHRDRAWLRICRPAIERADWLGVHCYWQTPPDGNSVMLAHHSGLAFTYYHEAYPDKVLEILECGNSNGQRPEWPISDEAVAAEYERWLQEVFRHPYINSASFFILSSPDQGNWSSFSWRREDGSFKPVVIRIGGMHRPPLTGATATRPTPPPLQKPGQALPDAQRWRVFVSPEVGLWLRSGPASSFNPPIKLLPYGAPLTVLAQEGVWLFVDAEGQQGWVHGDYVQRQDVVPFAAPVAEAGSDFAIEEPVSFLPLIEPPTSDLKKLDPELYAAWKEHVIKGFAHNERMFGTILDAMMVPYYSTIWMYRILFGVGVAAFVVAAIVGVWTGEAVFSLVFGGLSVLAFLGYFIGRPVQALEENLNFITWLGLIYNTYWTRTVYMMNQKTVQTDLNSATHDAVASIKDLLKTHQAHTRKRPGGE